MGSSYLQEMMAELELKCFARPDCGACIPSHLLPYSFPLQVGSEPRYPSLWLKAQSVQAPFRPKDSSSASVVPPACHHLPHSVLVYLSLSRKFFPGYVQMAFLLCFFKSLFKCHLALLSYRKDLYTPHSLTPSLYILFLNNNDQRLII